MEKQNNVLQFTLQNGQEGLGLISTTTEISLLGALASSSLKKKKKSLISTYGRFRHIGLLCVIGLALQYSAER